MKGTKQARAQAMNWLKGRLLGTKATFYTIVVNEDLPKLSRIQADAIIVTINEILKVWPKHLPKKNNNK